MESGRHLRRIIRFMKRIGATCHLTIFGNKQPRRANTSVGAITRELMDVRGKEAHMVFPSASNSPETADDDRLRIERLYQFMPSEDELRNKVTTFLRSQRAISVENSLGGTRASAKQLAEVTREEGHDVNLAQFQADVEHELEAAIQMVYQNDSALTARFVEDAVEHARTEFVHQWSSTLLMAWSMWGNPVEGLILNDLLLPDLSRCSVTPSDWNDALKEAHGYLRSALIMSTDDLREIAKSFCGNVMNALKARPVELPDGVDISLDRDRKIVLLKAREPT